MSNKPETNYASSRRALVVLCFYPDAPTRLPPWVTADPPEPSGFSSPWGLAAPSPSPLLAGCLGRPSSATAGASSLVGPAAAPHTGLSAPAPRRVAGPSTAPEGAAPLSQRCGLHPAQHGLIAPRPPPVPDPESSETLQLLIQGRHRPAVLMSQWPLCPTGTRAYKEELGSVCGSA